MTDSEKTPTNGAGAPEGWRKYRQEIRFLTLFVLILAGSFTLVAWNPVNDHVIEPFTGLIAKASGATLEAIGQGTRMQGTIIRNEKFAVNIKNGCNGVEAMLIYFAAVLAFPAPWKSRLFGVFFGFFAIQLVNLIRVVALFLTGVYFPKLFDSSHTVIWQTVVILAGVLFWILWANRFAGRSEPPAEPA